MQELYEHVRDAMEEPSCFQAENNSCPAHFHSSIELVYTLKGTINTVIDGVHYDVGENQVLIVSSYEVHHYYTQAFSDVIITIIPLSFVPSLEKKLTKKTFASHLYTDSSGALKQLFQLFSSSFHSLGKEATRGYCQLILGLLIDSVGLLHQPMPVNAGLSRSILSYIQTYYTSFISMEKMAMDLGYSRSYLSKVFKENFGTSFTDYVNSLRCRKAAQLLREKENSILETSMMSGFECVRTFYRVFKKEYAMTPSQYIKHNNELNVPTVRGDHFL
ncbi:MAG: AraC family transcriptional regulator [Clostridiales bacterium]|nr:AraC family transcriptional regulator [Clostridiales bacterium]